MIHKRVSLLIILFIMTLFSISQTASASQRFADIPLTHRSYGEIQYLTDLNVIAGIKLNDTFYYKPGQTVKRWEAAKMVVVATGNKPKTVTTSSFSDITAGTVISQYVESATSLGYFNVAKGTKFEPYNGLTRQEMARVLSVAFKYDVSQYANMELPFTDVAKSNPYYKYVAAVYYNGVAAGVNSTSYSLNDMVTREQFALFVARALNSKYRLDKPVQGVSVPDASKAIGQVRVTVDNLNVRSTSDFSSSANNVIGRANTGDVFDLYETSSSAYKIEYNGRYAYIYKNYAVIETGQTPVPPQEPVPTNPTDDALAKAKTIGIATVNSLNVRKSASASAERIGTLALGEKVAVQSISGNWATVSYQGAVGYVHKTYLRLKNTSGSVLANRIIVVDPGHGGTDPGAIGGTLLEKQVALKVSLKLKAKLEAAGAKVVMTRTGDSYPTLQDRVAIAKNNFGELFVSIHTNSATNTSANGAETYYSITGNENEREDAKLAKFINDEIVKNANMLNRGVKREDFYVVRNLTMPAVLVELGFISNPEDRTKLADDAFIEVFAKSIYNGMVKYYSQ